MTRTALLLTGMLLTTPHTTAAAPAPPTACAPGDHDGDGIQDVAVGDPLSGPGAVYLISGGEAVPLPAPSLSEGDGYGWSVRLADLNGDGCADVVAGAPYADVNGVRDAGAVFIRYGGNPRTRSVRLTAATPQADAHFGWSLAAKGDLLAIGAPYEDEAGVTDQGAVYAGRVNSLRRLSQDRPGLPGNGEVGDQYGWALTFMAGNSLAIGVPYENDDGAGRQRDVSRPDTGSISVIADVTAARLTAVKGAPPNLPTGARFGYALAYSDSVGLAVSSPAEGLIRLFTTGLRRTAQIRQPRATSLAASADGRLAIGAAGTSEVRVVGPGRTDRTVPPPTPTGQSVATDSTELGATVSFLGNRLISGHPDHPSTGAISISGRNADNQQTIQPPTGVDFGVALG